MPEQQEIKIIRVMPETRLLVTGDVDRKMRVQFTVGNSGPFTVVLPAAGFTAQVARAAVEKEGREIQQLLAGR